jgi:hypothetical protein
MWTKLLAATGVTACLLALTAVFEPQDFYMVPYPDTRCPDEVLPVSALPGQC